MAVAPHVVIVHVAVDDRVDFFLLLLAEARLFRAMRRRTNATTVGRSSQLPLRRHMRLLLGVNRSNSCVDIARVQCTMYSVLARECRVMSRRRRDSYARREVEDRRRSLSRSD